MPELPEVETVRRTLTPAIGAQITRVWTSGKGLHMQRAPSKAKLGKLVGTRITGLRRIGKYLLVDTDGEHSLLVHLGMSGRFRIQRADEPRAPHTHVVLGLADGRELRFVDPRRFGQVDVAPRHDPRAHPALAMLGPDPLTDGIDPDAFYARARGKQAILKAFLLDQTVLAGVGNIYASEALWRARLKPTLRAHQLTRASAHALAAAVTAVIAHALDKGGTSLKDFVDADGREGENADYLQVYAREGEPCPSCRRTIKRAVHQGRATFYCPRCQLR
jgi:formamidopyrimidine-DNA glycosylase